MNILITGGSRGIGAACVRAFAKEGHRVAFVYRAQQAAAEALANETGALALQADLSDPDAICCIWKLFFKLYCAAIRLLLVAKRTAIPAEWLYNHACSSRQLSMYC